ADMSSSRLGTGSIKQAVRHVALITEGPAYSTCIPPPMPVDDTVKMLEPDADSKGNCTDSAMRSLNRKAAGDESGPMGMKRESWMVRRSSPYISTARSVSASNRLSPERGKVGVSSPLVKRRR